MEEGRRSFLAYQIISGVKFITVDEVRYKLIPSSKEIKLLAEHIYQETMYSLRFDNLITMEKAKLFLLGLGIWGPNEDMNLKKTETYLEDKKVDLYRASYDSKKIKRLRATIKSIKDSINKLYGRKHSLDYMTLNYHASLTKKKFITAMCLRDTENKSVYTEENFSDSDSTILEAVIDQLDRDVVTIEDFRELARNEPWRSIWGLGKESCIGACSAEWTDDQKMLVTFSKMYDNAQQSPDCPSDNIIEDDDMFDGWLIDQRRTREKEQKQKHVDTINNIPDKAQEVFVFSPTREDADRVYDMNDQDSRMKIKQRQAVIAQRGKVDAQDLPDTKLELRNQQIQEYKDKMHRGR